MDGPTREGAKLDLLLGSKEGQVTEVLVRDHFGTSDHNSISFKIGMENDRSGPKVKILNWGKANFDGIRQELSKVNWGSLWEGKGTSGKWEAFKNVLTRVQGKHIPLKVKGKAERSREHWVTRDTEALVKKKKEAHDMHRHLGSSESLEEL